MRLLELAESVPEKKDAHPGEGAAPSARAHRRGQHRLSGSRWAQFLAFLGELSFAFANMLRGTAALPALRFVPDDPAMRRRRAWDRCADQLFGRRDPGLHGRGATATFGAQIYVANLVGIGMVRDMGAMMTAIIMSGRTGAAFAAQLGTMKVTQEIDALTTMGISPMEFLVLPRVIALVLMMPLLCVYADFVGILGGAASEPGCCISRSTPTCDETVLDADV